MCVCVCNDRQTGWLLSDRSVGMCKRWGGDVPFDCAWFKGVHHGVASTVLLHEAEIENLQK